MEVVFIIALVAVGGFVHLITGIGASAGRQMDEIYADALNQKRRIADVTSDAGRTRLRDAA